jgi:hypothetical protein
MSLKAEIVSMLAKTVLIRRLSGMLMLMLMLSSEAVYATQFSVTGTITLVRSSSLLTGAQMGGTTIVQTSPALANGCAWLWVGATDTNTLAVVLTAKALNANVTIWYETTDGAPWGDNTACGITAIQQN